jgi:nitrogen fixation NifU-like protein
MSNTLYQEVLLAHNREPHHFGKPENYCCSGKAYNPNCGDDLMVYIQCDEPSQSLNLHFDGEACAVATASASLMSEVLSGKTKQEVIKACQHFVEVIENNKSLDDDALLTKLKPLLTVRDYPGRIGCATLAWRSVIKALNES